MTDFQTQAKKYAALLESIQKERAEFAYKLNAVEHDNRIALDAANEKIQNLKTDLRAANSDADRALRDADRYSLRLIAARKLLNRRKAVSAFAILAFAAASMISALLTASGIALPGWLMPLICVAAALALGVSNGWCDDVC